MPTSLSHNLKIGLDKDHYSHYIAQEGGNIYRCTPDKLFCSLDGYLMDRSERDRSLTERIRNKLLYRINRNTITVYNHTLYNVNTVNVKTICLVCTFFFSTYKILMELWYLSLTVIRDKLIEKTR